MRYDDIEKAENKVEDKIRRKTDIGEIEEKEPKNAITTSHPIYISLVCINKLAVCIKIDSTI